MSFWNLSKCLMIILNHARMKMEMASSCYSMNNSTKKKRKYQLQERKL